MIVEAAGALIADVGVATLVLIAAIAVLTSAIHGATGVAGGFLMAAALAPIIGVKPLIPVMSVSLLISHGARAALNMRDFNRTVYLSILVTGFPCIILGALIYGKIPASGIAFLLGSVILVSIPIRRWAKTRSIHASRPALHAAGAVYGGLSGASIGPGMLLVPFMMGYGLSKEAFVATLAAIAMTTNITRVSVYGGTNLLDINLVLLGVFVGVMTIPGNWIGRAFLRRMTGGHHAILVDILTIVGALNFFWIALRG